MSTTPAPTPWVASPPGLQGQPDHRLALGCIYISAAEGELERGPALRWDAGASGACQVTLPVPPALRGCVRPSAWHPDSVEPPALHLLASLAQGLLQPPVCRSLSWLQMTSSLVLPIPSFSHPGRRSHPQAAAGGSCLHPSLLFTLSLSVQAGSPPFLGPSHGLLQVSSSAETAEGGDRGWSGWMASLTHWM